MTYSVCSTCARSHVSASSCARLARASSHDCTTHKHDVIPRLLHTQTWRHPTTAQHTNMTSSNDWSTQKHDATLRLYSTQTWRHPPTAQHTNMTSYANCAHTNMFNMLPLSIYTENHAKYTTDQHANMTSLHPSTQMWRHFTTSQHTNMMLCFLSIRLLVTCPVMSLYIVTKSSERERNAFNNKSFNKQVVWIMPRFRNYFFRLSWRRNSWRAHKKQSSFNVHNNCFETSMCANRFMIHNMCKHVWRHTT